MSQSGTVVSRVYPYNAAKKRYASFPPGRGCLSQGGVVLGGGLNNLWSPTAVGRIAPTVHSSVRFASYLWFVVLRREWRLSSRFGDDGFVCFFSLFSSRLSLCGASLSSVLSERFALLSFEETKTDVLYCCNH